MTQRQDGAVNALSDGGSSPCSVWQGSHGRGFCHGGSVPAYRGLAAAPVPSSGYSPHEDHATSPSLQEARHAVLQPELVRAAPSIFRTALPGRCLGCFTRRRQGDPGAIRLGGRLPPGVGLRRSACGPRPAGARRRRVVNRQGRRGP